MWWNWWYNCNACWSDYHPTISLNLEQVLVQIISHTNFSSDQNHVMWGMLKDLCMLSLWEHRKLPWKWATNISLVLSVSTWKSENLEVEATYMHILTQFREEDCIGANDAMSCFRNKYVPQIWRLWDIWLINQFALVFHRAGGWT